MDVSTQSEEAAQAGSEPGRVVDPLTQLARRLASATAQDKTRGMFFLGTLDVVRAIAGEATRERCARASKERRFVPFFLYPVNDFLRLTYCAAGLLAPRLGGFDAAMKTLGEKATNDFLESAVGRTLLSVANGSPRRLVDNMPWGYAASVSYGKRTVSWSSEREGCLHVRGDFMPPPYHHGVLRAALEALGARHVRIEGRELDLLDCDYSLAWE
ncbi:DUF2378 family protein [Myxococcus sp. AS-1-15]|nr:DUF2378 family protein [Myxococcus sp. AS-1-15]